MRRTFIKAGRNHAVPYEDFNPISPADKKKIMCELKSHTKVRKLKLVNMLNEKHSISQIINATYSKGCTIKTSGKFIFIKLTKRQIRNLPAIVDNCGKIEVIKQKDLR